MKKRFISSIVISMSIGCIHLDQLALKSFYTEQSFEQSPLPEAPDYKSLEAWAAHPKKEDASDVYISDYPMVPPDFATVDVFFVHTTTWLGKQWNAPTDTKEVHKNTANGSMRNQASVFNGVGRVFAPYYRQANGHAFIQPDANGYKAIEIAYADVLEAFSVFLDEYNNGRPFIIASHSQGSILASRLLGERIVDSPDQEQLIAAYVIGGPVSEEFFGGLPICTSIDQTGCVVAFNVRGSNFQPNALEFISPLGTEYPPMEGRVCVNPLGEQNTKEAHQGALFFDTKTPTVLPNFCSARCEDGALIVENLSKLPKRGIMDGLLMKVYGEDNYHAIEYQMFYLNLREDSQRRVSYFLDNYPDN